MTRLLCPLIVVPLLLIGCTGDPAGPNQSAQRTELDAPAPSFASSESKLWTIKAYQLGFAGYTLRIAGILNGFDAAAGHASLVDRSDPSRRFHYRFSEGEARCEGGLPVVRLSGEGFMTDNAGGQQVGRDFKHDYSFTIPASTQDGPSQDDPRQGLGNIVEHGVMMYVQLVAGLPRELVGQTFLIEVDQAYISPDICGTR